MNNTKTGIQRRHTSIAMRTSTPGVVDEVTGGTDDRATVSNVDRINIEVTHPLLFGTRYGVLKARELIGSLMSTRDIDEFKFCVELLMISVNKIKQGLSMMAVNQDNVASTNEKDIMNESNATVIPESNHSERKKRLHSIDPDDKRASKRYKPSHASVDEVARNTTEIGAKSIPLTDVQPIDLGLPATSSRKSPNSVQSIHSDNSDVDSSSVFSYCPSSESDPEPEIPKHTPLLEHKRSSALKRNSLGGSPSTDSQREPVTPKRTANTVETATPLFVPAIVDLDVPIDDGEGVSIVDTLSEATTSETTEKNDSVKLRTALKELTSHYEDKSWIKKLKAGDILFVSAADYQVQSEHDFRRIRFYPAHLKGVKIENGKLQYVRVRYEQKLKPKRLEKKTVDYVRNVNRVYPLDRAVFAFAQEYGSYSAEQARLLADICSKCD